jgi:hypothetical protein
MSPPVHPGTVIFRFTFEAMNLDLFQQETDDGIDSTVREHS